MNKKIVSNLRLKKILDRARSRKKIVFTNGCFDLVHVGHVTLLQKAKRLGDILVLGLNSDASLQRLKGPSRPLVDERSRACVLAALACVDYVTIFPQDTPAQIIKLLRPHILVKGGDYKLDAIVGREFVDKVVRLPLVSGHSTSRLIEKIVKVYGKSAA